MTAFTPYDTALDSTPIDALWTQLHASGYLSPDNTTLALPAQNALGSAPIAALLGDPTLFPKASLGMTLTSALPTSSSIVLTGTLTGTFLGFPAPAGVATFTTDGGVAQLALVVSLPDSPVLGTAFPKLGTTAPGVQPFHAAAFTARSAAGGPSLTFSGTPVPDPSFAGLWKSGPGSVSAPITGWSARTTAVPTMSLATGVLPAAFGAGMLPLSAQLTLSSGANDAGTGTVVGTIATNFGAGSSPVKLLLPVTFALPVPPRTSALFDSGVIAVTVGNLSQLASFFTGVQLANLLPSQFDLGTGLTLSMLQMGLDPDGSGVGAYQVMLGSTVSIPLLPGKLAVLTGISVTFFLASGIGPQVVFTGHFKLNDNDNLAFSASFSLPNPVVTAQNDAPIDPRDLLQIIPGFPRLPDIGLSIDTLAASLVLADMSYTFTGAMTTTKGWSLDLGSGLTLIALKELGLTFSRSSSSSSVIISSNIVFLGSDVQVIAASQPATGEQPGGWLFTGTMTTPMKLVDIVPQLLPFVPGKLVPNITLDSLQCQFDTTDDTFSVQATADWKMDILPITIDGTILIRSSRTARDAPATYSGSVSGTIDIHGLVLEASYVFSPTTTDITFAYRSLTVAYHKTDATHSYVSISLGNSTVGDLFDFLLSFAQPGRTLSLGAPWDALAKIELPNLTLKVSFPDKSVEVDIDLDIDLGFLDLKRIALTYTRQYGKAKFNLELSGSFLGQPYGDSNNGLFTSGNPPLRWDPLNEAPPTVPGTGTQTFDLEYLGVGQHLSLRGAVPPTMDLVIKALEEALKPTGNPTQNPATQLPGLSYDAGSNWLIGTRFTAMSTLELSLIFNDPKMYGLLIQLSGKRAGPLAGLRFEILYRKISDSLGVYHIELTLPDIMRHLEFGEVSITLPIITIDIYTNGNFRVDAGFPPSLTDFSRSFCLQVFPFVGYGGFYFAVLNGQTSTNVPQISNGNFSPVLEFGLALQVGVGKTISVGILSGGISITVGGMVQGVLAWFTPDQQGQSPERFYHLTGTVAVVGQVYATVDFGIIQASVSLMVYASVSVELESYKAIRLSVSAGVEVEVSIKILFIRIHFSFGATITEDFVIGSDSATPWVIGPPSGGSAPARREYRQQRHLARQRPFGLLRARPARRLQQRAQLLRRSMLGQNATVPIQVTALPLVSKALGSDFSFPGAPTPPVPAGSSPVVALLLGLETSVDPTAGANVLMAFLLEWVVDAIGHESDTVSAAVLDEILATLSDPSTADDVFSYTALQALFTSNGLVFTLMPRPTVQPGDEVPIALMAMIPELALSAPAYGTQPGYGIQFWSDRVPTGNYEQTVEDYFAELSAQFAEREQQQLRDADGAPESLAIFVFRYYFLMLARGAVQAAKQMLASTTATLTTTTAPVTSLASLANGYNNDYTARQGDTLTAIAASFGLTVAQLQTANPAYASRDPRVGETVFIPAVHVAYVSRTDDTLNGLAATFGLDASRIQGANPTVNFNPLAAGTALVIPGMRVVHGVVAGQTGVAIATEFGVELSALMAANPTVDFDTLPAGTPVLIPLGLTPAMVATANQAAAGIIAAKVTLVLGDIPIHAAATDSLSGIATQFGVPLYDPHTPDLLTTNLESLSLLAPGQTIDADTLSYVTRVGDSLDGVIAYWYDRAPAFDLAGFLVANPTLAVAGGQTLTIPSATSRDTTDKLTADQTLAAILAAYTGLTAAALLASNASITLVVGQAISLPKVQYVTSGSYLLSYTATTNDTLAAIAGALFAPDVASQLAAVQALRQWNGQMDAGVAIPAGTRITVPYASSLGNISRQLEISLETLAANEAMGQPTLLAQRAALTVPQVSLVTKGTETLAGLAQAYDLSLEQLAERIAQVPGLFAPGAVKVTAIPGMLLSPLCGALASNGGFTTALNMASRFMFNGLRLPAPQFSGLATPSDTAAFPLYALIGQEFPVTASLPNNYTLTLTAHAGVTWVSLPGGTLAIQLDGQELTLVQQFDTLQVQPGIDQNGIQALATYAYVPDRQPPGAITWWHTADLPAGLVPDGQKAGQPSIWTLPGALQDALAASPAGRLLYRPTAGTTNPDGSVTSTVLAASRFATTVDITVQLPPDATAGTYLVVGADQAGLQRLLAVWAHLATSGTSATLYLAYASQQSNGGQGIAVSDDVDRHHSFLLKTNLSTESHGTPQLALDDGRVGMLNGGLLDAAGVDLTPTSSTDFLQLLWECSIVKSGGFYLRYARTGGDLGLPATLFAAGSEATIQVVVVLDEQGAGSPVALPFNNAVLVGDNIDPGATSLALEALTHPIIASDTLASIVTQHAGVVTVDPAGLAVINRTIVGTLAIGANVAGQIALADDSFATLAARAGIDAAALGARIANVSNVLRPGALLELSGNTAQTVRDGDTLQSISAAYDFLDAASLATLNARTAGLLAANASMSVPGQSPYVIKPNDTFGGIATKRGVDLAALGAANATTAVLAAGGSIIVGSTALKLAATQPPGRIGFDVTRANPDPDETPTPTSQQSLNLLFNLLGFQVSGNASFTDSKLGLPAGPTGAAKAAWKYRQLLSVFPLATTNETFTASPLPVRAGNPYAGITKASSASVALFLTDVLGNHADGGALSALTVPVGYTDEIVALSSWPAVTSSYRFGGTSAPYLELDVTVAVDQFVPDASTVSMPAGAPDKTVLTPAARRAAGALARFGGASYQLQQADVTCQLSTTLGPIASPDSVGALARATLLGVANGGFLFTQSAQGLAPTQAALGGGSTGFANIAALVDTSAGYPVSLADLGQMNAQAGADLLFGIGKGLSVPVNLLARAGETPASIAARSDVPPGQPAILIGTLADNNAAVPVAPAVVVATAVRKYTMAPANPLPCLSALATMAGTTLADGAGRAPGFASTNAKVPLAPGLSLVLGTFPAFATTGTESLTDAADWFRLKGSTDALAVDVAMANQYLDGIFPITATLSVASALTVADDTLATLAASYGPPSGQTGSAAAQMLAGNQNVPGFWPVGATLFIRNANYPIQRGDTLTAIASANNASVAQLLSDNTTVSFVDATKLLVPFHADNPGIAAALWQNPADAALNDILAVFAGWSIDDMVTANGATPGLFAAVPITIGGTQVTPDATSTFVSLAAAFKIGSPTKFATQVATLASLMRGGGIWLTPPFASAAAESVTRCAQRYGLTPGALAGANATLPSLLAAGQSGRVEGIPYQTFTNDTLGMLTARINVLRVAGKLAPLSVTALFTLQEMAGIVLAARTLLAPPAAGRLFASVAAADDHAILDLTVTLTTRRDPARVAAAFLESPRVLSSPVVVTAQPFAAGATPSVQSLHDFATDFEKAFVGHKLATGPQQVQGSSTITRPSLKGATPGSGPAGSRGATLWVVNFSGTGSSFTYAVDPTSVRFFGVPPLATEPFSGSSVVVPTYDSTNGLQWPGKTVHIRSADPDQWNQTFLQAMDLVLSPRYAVPAAADTTVAEHVAAIVGAKADIAAGIANTVLPIIGPAGAGLSDACKGMKQQLLVTLSSAYTVQSIAQWDLSVTGTGAGTDPASSPQLFGKVAVQTLTVPEGPTTPVGANPFAALATLAGVSMPYLARVVADLSGIVQPNVVLRCTGSDTEHTTTGSDTLGSIASIFEVKVEALPDDLQLSPTDTLFRPGATVNATPVIAPSTLDTVTGIAEWMQVTTESVLSANAPAVDFFVPGQLVQAGGTSYTPSKGDTLAVVAGKFGGIEAFAADLASVDAGTLPGGYTLNVKTPVTGLRLIPQLSLSAAKGPLATSGSHITSLFGTKDPAAQTSVTLRLEYQVNQMEFDIHTVQGVQGYRSSSWLTFIVPINGTPADEIGQVQIPIPLRGYPTPATISHQSAVASDSTEGAQGFAQWDYGFTTSARLAAQDQLTLDVMMNAPADSTMLGRRLSDAPDNSGVIAALAAFAAVWPTIADDLAQLPDGADGTVPPPAANAVSALASLATLIQGAWNAKKPQRLGQGLPPKTFTYLLSTLIDQRTGTNGEASTFAALTLDRVDQKLDFATLPDDFLFTANASFAAGLNANKVDPDLGQRFVDYGFTLSTEVVIKPAVQGAGNVDWLIFDAGTPSTTGDDIPPATYRVLLVTVSGVSVLQVWRQLLWPSLRVTPAQGAPGDWLDGRQAGTRLAFDIESSAAAIDQPLTLAFDFGRLNALFLQNGWGGTSISRNANLIAGATTNGAFVTQTPLQLFATRITPMLSRTLDTDLSRSGETLATALPKFFEDLVAAQTAVLPATKRNMRVSAAYWQAADGAIAPDQTPFSHRNPLLLVPLYAFDVSTDWQAGGFCDQLTAAIEARAADMGVTPVSQGRWVVEVLVYDYDDSGTSPAPQALLSIENRLFPATAVTG